MQSRIMYIECKGPGVASHARIGRVTFTRFSRAISYRGKSYQPHADRGKKANYYEVETGIWYWITNCRKNGLDAIDPQLVEIDEDVQQEYWQSVRSLPENIGCSSFQSPGSRA